MKTLLQRTLLTAVATMVLMIAPLSVADQHEQADQQQQAMLSAQGAGYWATQCRRCHNLRDPGEFTDDIWDVSVNHMRIRANIPAEQIRAIKAFLKSSN